MRGEGEGLLRAIIDANKLSEKISDRRVSRFIFILPKQKYCCFNSFLFNKKQVHNLIRKIEILSFNQLDEDIGFDHPLPESDDDEDYIDTGAAILNFYCTLVDLLGRCAPDSSVIEQGLIHY